MQSKTKSAVVTGANGFVGSKLIHELVQKGYRVYAVVRNQNSNLESIPKHNNVKIIYCELKNISLLPKLIENEVWYFYHFAWEGTSGIKRGDYVQQLDNVKYTCDAVMAAFQLKCKRFLHAGSIMEYEAMQYISKDGAKPGAGYVYSTAKLAADYMAKVTSVNLGIEYINYVISNIYGEGEISPRFVNITIRKMLNNERLSFTEGIQRYDFIYITDAVRAMCLVAERGEANSEYYIGNKNLCLLNEYITRMRDIVDKTLTLYFGDIKLESVMLNYDLINTGRLEEELEFVAQVSFEDGIRKTKKWIEEYAKINV